MTDPWPVVRLWQAVLVQAIYDASHPNPHQLEAQTFVAGKLFADLCDLLNLNERVIRLGLEGDVWERMRKQRRNGGFR